MKLHIQDTEIRGDSRLLFNCNHLTPVYKKDVELFQLSKKYSIVYCARCEAKNVATKVIRMLERREHKIAMAASSEDTALLEFIDSSSLYKIHPAEHLELFKDQELEDKLALKKKFKKEEKRLKSMAEEWPMSHLVNYKSNNRTFDFLRE
jgi:hypothetical protein